MKSFVFLTAFVTLTQTVGADHRLALLIGNSSYQDKSLATPARDLDSIAADLSRRGFRCQVVKNLDEKQLKSTIEDFASTTPTCGTALVYFHGQVLAGSYNGKSGTCILGCNSKQGRGYRLDLAIQDLSTRGGSLHNLFIADSPAVPPSKIDLPPGCLLAYCDANGFQAALSGHGDLIGAITSRSKAFQSTIAQHVAITGKGSFAISPPETFVQGKKAGDEWVNRRGMVFCWCPPGTYIAGSPEGTPGRYADEDQREVTIEDGFWIGKYELTLSQNLRNHPHNTIATHKTHPLTMINHDDAKSMTMRTLSGDERKHGRLPNDWQYSLPTEEQWEYAARAGTTTRFYFGDDLRKLPEHANFGDKSFYDSKDIYSNAASRTLDDGTVRLAKVGSYQPNPWGLHDVYGNVAEWCISTAIRGGSWVSVAENCRSAYRDSFSSRNEQNFIGYRLVIQKVPPRQPK